MTTLSSRYTAELKKLVALSKSIILKDQVKADIYEADVIKQTISYDYTPLSEDWQEVTAYINTSSEEIVIRPEKYWRVVNSSTSLEGRIDKEKQKLWVRVSDSLWREFFTNEITPTVSQNFTSIRILPEVTYYIDLFKAKVFITKKMWFEEKSNRFSMTLPKEITKIEGESKTYLPGLSSVITTPQEYITATYELLSGNISNERKLELEKAITEFKSVGEWEDLRESYYLRNDNGMLILDENNLPTINPKRFKQVAFKGEKNNYYRELVADYNIDPFISRTSSEFEVLHFSYLLGEPKSLVDDFMKLLNENIQVFKNTIYNGVYRSEKEYYNWCKMYLMWMTIMRYESFKMANVHDIDKLEDRDINNLLYSSNLFQFNDIPINYKRRIVKSIERLIARKGTTQVFEDILKLFNLDREIKITKFYLIKNFPNTMSEIRFPDFNKNTLDETSVITLVINNKNRNFKFNNNFDDTLDDVIKYLKTTEAFNEVTKTPNGFVYSIKENSMLTHGISAARITDSSENTIFANNVSTEIPDWYKPSLAFLETDVNNSTITQDISANKLDTSKKKEYDNFVASDPRWQVTKEELYNEDFSVLQTKYLSVSTAIDLVQNGMSISFLWGMLKNLELQGLNEKILVIEKSEGNLDIPQLSLFEAMTGLLCLTLWKYNVDDIIPHEKTGVETIIAGKQENSNFPNEDLLIPNFRTKLWSVNEVALEESSDLSPEIVGKTIDRNIEISDKISDKIANFVNGNNNYYKYEGFPNTSEYNSAYEHFVELRNLQNHKMTAKVQYDCFGDSVKYSEWVNDINPEFFTWLENHDKFNTYDDAILYLTQIIEDKINNNNFNFSMMTGINSIVINYVERLIRFFKSYTVDLKDVNIYFKVGDASLEGLHLLNQVEKFETNTSFKEYVEGVDSHIIYTEKYFKSLLKNKDMIHTNDIIKTLKLFLKHEDLLTLGDILLDTIKVDLNFKEFIEGLDSQFLYGTDSIKSYIDSLDEMRLNSLINNLVSSLKNSDTFNFFDESLITNYGTLLFSNNVEGIDSQITFDNLKIIKLLLDSVIEKIKLAEVTYRITKYSPKHKLSFNDDYSVMSFGKRIVRYFDSCFWCDRIDIPSSSIILKDKTLEFIDDLNVSKKYFIKIDYSVLSMMDRLPKNSTWQYKELTYGIDSQFIYDDLFVDSKYKANEILGTNDSFSINVIG